MVQCEREAGQVGLAGSEGGLLARRIQLDPSDRMGSSTVKSKSAT